MIIQKISLEQREIIISQFKKGLKTLADFGREYDVTKATIYKIIHNGLSRKQIELIKRKRSIDKKISKF